MASYLSLHKLRTTHHSHRPGILGMTLGTGAGFGSAVGLGYLYATHRDKWYGKYLPYIVALGGKVAAVGAAASGHGTIAVVSNDIGQSAVALIGANIGVKMALKKKGLRAVTLPEAEAAKLPASALMGALNESTARGMDRQAVDALYREYA
jgi:hypothetical protein